MIIGQRIVTRLTVLDMSQSELARRVGMSQGAMNNLIAGRSRSSTHLHTIARELQTTPAYLAGETDDPDANAPAPPAKPRHQLVTLQLQVVLPSEDALAQMFEGLLLSAGVVTPVDALARTLAKRLPIGLSQLRDLLPTDLTDEHYELGGDRPPRGTANRVPLPTPRN